MTERASLTPVRGAALTVPRIAVRNAVAARDRWRTEISQVQASRPFELMPQSLRSTSRIIYFVKSTGPFSLVSKLKRDMAEITKLSRTANPNRHRRPKELWTPSIVTDPQKITIVKYDVRVKRPVTRAQATRFAAKAGADIDPSDEEFFLRTITGKKYVMRVVYDDGVTEDFDLREWNVCVWTKAGPPSCRCVLHDIRGIQGPEDGTGHVQDGCKSEKFRKVCEHKRSVLYAKTGSPAK